MTIRTNWVLSILVVLIYGSGVALLQLPFIYHVSSMVLALWALVIWPIITLPAFWLWYDVLAFGKGHGMSMPSFHNAFYWLVDRHPTQPGFADFYQLSGWLGCQLVSYQWTVPPLGERRHICGYEFKPVESHRRWGRVRVCWGAVFLPEDLNDANLFLKQMQTTIRNVTDRVLM